MKIGADDIDIEPPLDVAQDAAARAADIENAPDGERVTARRRDNGANVSQEAVNSRQLAIGAILDGLRHTTPIQNFDVRGLPHGRCLNYSHGVTGTGVKRRTERPQAVAC